MDLTRKRTCVTRQEDKIRLVLQTDPEIAGIGFSRSCLRVHYAPRRAIRFFSSCWLQIFLYREDYQTCTVHICYLQCGELFDSPILLIIFENTISRANLLVFFVQRRLVNNNAVNCSKFSDCRRYFVVIHFFSSCVQIVLYYGYC